MCVSIAMMKHSVLLVSLEQSNTCLQDGEGILPEVNPLALLPVLADFLQLKDPNMLPLEVSGLTSKYPDIR